MGFFFYQDDTEFMIENKILLTDCSDAIGLISKIKNIIYKHKLINVPNNQFLDI